MTDKERYATIGTWVEVFRKERVELNDVSIRYQLSSAGIIGHTCRNKIGRVVREGFYAESDVRRLCESLLLSLPQADEDGLIEKGGQIYGTIESLSRSLGIAASTIKQKIQTSTLTTFRGKNSSGRVCNFYSVSDVRKLFEDLLQDLPQAGEDGFFEKDGTVHGTVIGLSRQLGISIPAIRRGIRNGSLKAVRGKDKGGRVWDFYSLSEVRRLCDYLLQDMPQADEKGFFESNGETYGIVESFLRALGISGTAIIRRIQGGALTSITGKTQGGRVCDFYSLAEVQNLCADLIAKRKKE